MKVLIVDDHKLMIEGLLALLTGEMSITVVDVASHGRQALEILGLHEVDVVLTDISMPIMDGVDLTTAITRQYPKIKVIALTMHGDSQHITSMLEAGVSGYIYKNVSNTELITAIKRVYEGGTYYSEEIAAVILKTAHSQIKIQAESNKVNLTSREKEIITLISQEQSNAAIAAQLFISERTVETHRKNIYNKTKTSSLVGLIKWAYENKVI
jgi:two-component system, NarL family, nitrate/nitrite response regulator NarL